MFRLTSYGLKCVGAVAQQAESCVRESATAHQPHLVPEVERVPGLGRALEDADGVAGEEQQADGRDRDGPEHLRRRGRAPRQDDCTARTRTEAERRSSPVGGGRS